MTRARGRGSATRVVRSGAPEGRPPPSSGSSPTQALRPCPTRPVVPSDGPGLHRTGTPTVFRFTHPVSHTSRSRTLVPYARRGPDWRSGLWTPDSNGTSVVVSVLRV